MSLKLISDTIIIDRKIRFHASPKTSIALKYLRSQLTSNIATQFRGKSLTGDSNLWNDIAMKILGKVKLEAESSGLGIIVH